MVKLNFASKPTTIKGDILYGQFITEKRRYDWRFVLEYE